MEIKQLISELERNKNQKNIEGMAKYAIDSSNSFGVKSPKLAEITKKIVAYLKNKDSNPSYYLKDAVEIDFITKDSLIEAKYNRELEDKQKQLFDSIKIKNKIIANGCSFFVD